MGKWESTALPSLELTGLYVRKKQSKKPEGGKQKKTRFVSVFGETWYTATHLNNNNKTQTDLYHTFVHLKTFGKYCSPSAQVKSILVCAVSFFGLSKRS